MVAKSWWGIIVQHQMHTHGDAHRWREWLYWKDTDASVSKNTRQQQVYVKCCSGSYCTVLRCRAQMKRRGHQQIEQKDGELVRAGGKGWDHVKRELDWLRMIKHSCFKSALRQTHFFFLLIQSCVSRHPPIVLPNFFFLLFYWFPVQKVAGIRTRADSRAAAITTTRATCDRLLSPSLTKVCVSLSLCELWAVARGAAGVNWCGSRWSCGKLRIMCYRCVAAWFAAIIVTFVRRYGAVDTSYVHGGGERKG